MQDLHHAAERPVMDRSDDCVIMIMGKGNVCRRKSCVFVDFVYVGNTCISVQGGE